ncbi:MAG TPA: twin-arginine translocase TatA/TatE family subunit [Phycisphaerae bacterium]|nr:twin-arginine translocase TatA/TatE family subunit [Phycisphaerae bacterium]
MVAKGLIQLALFGSFGWQEILIILAVLLLLFGGRKLPELARGLAKSLKVFKKEMRDVKDDLEDAADTEAEPPPAKSIESKSDDQKPQQPTG